LEVQGREMVGGSWSQRRLFGVAKLFVEPFVLVAHCSTGFTVALCERRERGNTVNFALYIVVYSTYE
jgi:hypothetical protein